MRLAFYRSDSPGSQLWDKLIAAYTNGKFSHVELLFDSGRCFSSSPRDGGCRWKTIENINDPATWTLVDLGKDDFDDAVSWFCQSQNGKPYDWLGIAGFPFPFVRTFDHPRRRWFCSEICAAALQAGGWPIPGDPLKISPNLLYQLATNL